MTSNPDTLISRALEQLRAIALPESTYRIQLHKRFTFADATKIIPYLAALGVTHLYCSPYLKAAPGSTHGYDVIDHCQLNPELGSQADFETLLATLKQHGLSHVLDTVPNHAGVATNENTWWNEVLEDGLASPYAHHFDISWFTSPQKSLFRRVLIPSLGDTFGNVLEKGDLKIVFENGKFFVAYYDRRFPLSPSTYGQLLCEPTNFLDTYKAPVEALLKQFAELPAEPKDDAALKARRETKVRLQAQLAELGSHVVVKRWIDRCVEIINGKPGEARTFDRLDQLLEKQNFRLASWKTAPDEINYRRFFDVNDLAGLRQELLPVFEETHALTLGLVADGKVAGLRIDHPDGLFDPATYLHRLQTYAVLGVARRLAGASESDWPALQQAILEELPAALDAEKKSTGRWPLYVLVEKILAMGEPLPTDWATAGTSGYDFLNMASGLFVDAGGEAALTQTYQHFTGKTLPFADLIYEKKKLILDISLASELQMLARELEKLAQLDRHSRDYTLRTLRHALREVVACFSVYRSYVSDAGTTPTDAKVIGQAIDAAKARNPIADVGVFDFIRDSLLLKYGERFGNAERALQRHFAGKFQQLTSPTTAKGIEDTAFYSYNRLLSLNEVGGEPSHFGVSAKELHAYFAERQRAMPYAMSTLSTHDTKRSEDVRARLHVLSEIPNEWATAVERWSSMNASLLTKINGTPSPDRNDEYAIYQTLLGAWPLDGASSDEMKAFGERVRAYLLKADREAKVHTIWTAPNEPYEKAVAAFITGLLNRSQSAGFLDDFSALRKRVTQIGFINSLSQTVLKLAAPGVPDTYQGTELWDFSLVDPDNRRPVEYDQRRAGLRAIGDEASAEIARATLANLADGRAKLLVHERLLHLRKSHPGLLSGGTYEPVAASGPLADHVFAFVRRLGKMSVLVVVPRCVAKLAGDAHPIGQALWGETSIAMPNGAGGLESVLTGRTITTKHRVSIGELLGDFPVGVFVSK